MRVDSREALTADTDYMNGMKARTEFRHPDTQMAVEGVRKRFDQLADGGTRPPEVGATDEDIKFLQAEFRRIAEDTIGVTPEEVAFLFPPERLLSVEPVRQRTDVVTDIATFFKTPLGQRFMTLQPEDRQKMITQVGSDFD